MCFVVSLELMMSVDLQSVLCTVLYFHSQGFYEYSHDMLYIKGLHLNQSEGSFIEYYHFAYSQHAIFQLYHYLSSCFN